MSSKRGFEEVDSTTQADQGHSKKRYKRGNKYDAVSNNPNPYNSAKHSKHKAREGTINWVKKRARAIERSFQKDSDSLPRNKVEDLKRELESHRRTIQDAENKKERQRMISKYHMVRFFGKIHAPA